MSGPLTDANSNPANVDALLARINELESELRELGERPDGSPGDRREVELQLSEDRYRVLFEAPFEGIIISQQSKIVDANRAALEMFGYAHQELCGKLVEELAAAPSRPMVRKHVANGFQEVYEHTAITKNGRCFDVEVRGKTVLYQGRSVRVAAVRDVTEAKAAEMALRRSEAQYRSMVTNIPYAAWTSDQNGRARFVTPNIEDVCGYKPEDFCSSGESLWSRNIHPDDRAKVSEGINGLFGKRKKLDVEYRFRHKKGHWIWLHDIAVATVEPDGKARADGVCSGITERKEAESALRESQRALSTLMSNLPGMAYRCLNDRNWTMEFVSEGCHELTGYQPEALMGNKDVAYANLIHVDDQETVWADVQAGVDNRRAFTLSYRIRTRAGDVKWVWEQGRGVWDEAGDLVALEGFITDVTSRKLAQDALQQGREELELRVEERTIDLTTVNARLLEEIKDRERAERELLESTKEIRRLAEERRVLLQNTSDFVYRHDVQGVFDYLSPSIEQITGYSVAEWAKHYTTYMTDNPMNDRVIEITEQAVRTGKQAPPYLVEIRHKDGRRLTLELNEKPYFEDGQVAGIIGVARDVTKRLKAERALRESEERLQAILDNANAAIYTKDLYGKYLLVNKRFEDIIDLQRESVVGKTDFDIFPHETAKALRENDQVVIDSGEAIQFEEVVPHDDGLHTYISQKFSLYDSHGVPYATCGISTDITARKQAEKTLLAAKNAAEAANRAKSVFLANVSHEIRTPIAAMLGATEVLSAENIATAEFVRRRDIILRNGKHLLSLIDELLDLSRAEAGQLEVVRTECSLMEILADAFSAMQPLGEQQGLELRLIFDSKIPTRIRTDALRMKQALINLIGNALKFTQEGHVWVRVSVESGDGHPCLIVAVEDTGVGIAQDDLERVFDVFAQVETAADAVASGVGLGLPFVRWIADQLGGKVSLASTKGKGSRFVLSVDTGPLDGIEFVSADMATASARTSRAVEAVKTSVRLHGKILLAEDFGDVRDVMYIALTDAGAEVTAVEDGESAIRAVSENQFDLILLDIRMAPVDGLTAVTELRRRGCLIPIIAVTASAAESDRSRILRAGFDDHWAKPIPLGELVARVEEYLDTDRACTDRADDKADRVLAGTSKRRLAAIASAFASHLQGAEEELQAALVNDDLQTAREILHRLAGAAGMQGYMQISKEAGRLLKEMKKGRFVGSAESIQVLADLMRSARAPQAPSETAAHADEPDNRHA